MITAEMMGENIKKARKDKNMTQQEVAIKSELSTTNYNAYERGNKRASLDTLAAIAKTLNVSIDELYYGDESKAFLTRESKTGRKIVNAVYYLWEEGVISSVISDYSLDGLMTNSYAGTVLQLYKYADIIERLVDKLEQFKNEKEHYPDPDDYLEMILAAAANNIESEIKKEKK